MRDKQTAGRNGTWRPWTVWVPSALAFARFLLTGRLVASSYHLSHGLRVGRAGGGEDDIEDPGITRVALGACVVPLLEAVGDLAGGLPRHAEPGSQSPGDRQSPDLAAGGIRAPCLV